MLCILFGYYSTRLETDASSQSLLLENDKDLEIWREVSKRYETPNFLLIAYTPNGDLLGKNSLNKIRKIENELKNFEFVSNVMNITNVPLLQNKEQKITDLINHVPTLNDENIDINAARDEFLTSPFYASNLVSSDLKTTAIVINLVPNLDYDNLRIEVEKLKNIEKLSKEESKKLKNLEREFKNLRDKERVREHENLERIRGVVAKYSTDGDKLFLGGMNMIADDMITFVKNDIVIYGASSFLLLIFCFWLFFRQVRFVLIPIVICATSVVFASGLFGFLGYEISVISSNYIALQLIITVSVSIHLIVGYREYATLRRHLSQNQLVYLTLRDRSKPCFFAIFTTIIGFFSLIFSNIKPVIMLGIMMSAGISISLIVAFVVFGAIMVLMDKIYIEHKFENSFNFTLWCANLAINHRKIIYFICFICLACGIYGISKLRVENSFIGYFKDDTAIHAGMIVVDRELGGTVPFDVVIKFRDKKEETKPSGDEFFDEFENEFKAKENDAQYWFSSERMRIIAKVDEFLKSREFVGNVSSLNTLLEVGKRLNNGKNLDDFMLSVMYNELPENYRKIVLSPYISIEENEAHFSVRTIDSDENLRRDEFLKSLNSDLDRLLKDDNVDFSVSGVMVLYNNMLQSLTTSQFGTLGFTILALFFVFVILFRSVIYALIALIVNLIPLCLGFGIMGMCGISLDIMSVTIATISIGIGVDDVIHYIHRYRIERRTKASVEAILASHRSIGYAMYYTSFAIILGFSVMMISNFWPTIYFGFLIDLIMALLLLGALVILPAVILSCKK